MYLDLTQTQSFLFTLEGMSTTIIAAMELKYPDGEEKRKNDVCRTLPVSFNTEDLFLSFRKTDFPYFLFIF